MATFKIGQRVRIVSAPAYQYLVGAESVITHILESGDRGTGYRLAICAPIALGHNIEPVIDDGRKTVAWSECLWRPTQRLEIA